MDRRPLTLAPEPHDLLQRYISAEEFKKTVGFYAVDPLIDEFTYGEGRYWSPFLWKHIDVGSRVFFHTTIGGTRYLTAMYRVCDFAPEGVWRLDGDMRRKYRLNHLHPEEYPDWDADTSLDAEAKRAYESGSVLRGTRIVLIGDPERSVDLRKTPLVLNREILARLDLRGKPIKWDITTKTGRKLSESECVRSCLRVPRVLSRIDGDFLEQLVRKQAEGIRSEPSFSHFVPIGDPIVASHMAMKCATEEEIESYIVDKLGAIEKGLLFVARQVRLDDGDRIDILARRPDGTPVVIEFKKGTADDRTLTQLQAYLWKYNKQSGSREAIGKIVCADASPRLKVACQQAQVQIHFYGDILFRSE